MKIGVNDIVDCKIGTNQVAKVYLGSDLVWEKVSASVLDFSPYNVWDSENLVISGTSTTLTDFNNVGTTYNLVNPAATNQPTYAATDSDFNNLPSLTFDGVDNYVKNSVSGYRFGDSSGMYISVFKYLSGSYFQFLASADESANTRFIAQNRNPGVAQYQIRQGNNTVLVDTTQDNVAPNDVTIQALAGDGTNYVTYNQDGVIVNSLTGTYRWFNGVTNRSNVVIGANVRGVIDAANISWCMSGYFPYVDDATTLNLISFLKTKYGIS